VEIAENFALKETAEEQSWFYPAVIFCKKEK